ncbi:MAG TPA: c-type cytochrome [Gemmataceae bacterium]|jgi:cytochrome c553|nr:c-type cytochrome [Gemmataceae bacterium]
MPFRFRAAAMSIVTVACAAVLLTPAAGEDTKPADDAKVSFKDDIQPLLVEKCGNCHGTKKAKKGVDYVTSYDTTMKTVKADKPEESRLFKSITGKGAKPMPPKNPLSADEIAKVKAWIAAGAKNN